LIHQLEERKEEKTVKCIDVYVPGKTEQSSLLCYCQRVLC
jgi:hypothetical protein